MELVEKRSTLFGQRRKRRRLFKDHISVLVHTQREQESRPTVFPCFPRRRRRFLSHFSSVCRPVVRRSVVRPQKKNGVIKAEFVKSGANARRLFVRAVSTCKEIVGVGEREGVRERERESAYESERGKYD